MRVNLVDGSKNIFIPPAKKSVDKLFVSKPFLNYCTKQISEIFFNAVSNALLFLLNSSAKSIFPYM